MAVEGIFFAEDLDESCRKIAEAMGAPYDAKANTCKIDLGYGRTLTIRNEGTHYTIKVSRAEKEYLKVEFHRYLDLLYTCRISTEHTPQTVYTRTCAFTDDVNTVLVTKRNADLILISDIKERKVRAHTYHEL